MSACRVGQDSANSIDTVIAANNQQARNDPKQSRRFKYNAGAHRFWRVSQTTSVASESIHNERVLIERIPNVIQSTYPVHWCQPFRASTICLFASS